MPEPVRAEERLADPIVQPHEIFEILVREHEPKLRAFVSGLVRDPAAVDDLVQEAFVIAWRNLDRYDRSLPFGPWLRGIGRKLCMAHYRKQSRQRVAFVEDEVVEHLSELYSQLDQAAGDTLDEQLASLRSCLEHLPEHQREVLTLHYDQELGCGEIADAIGKSREAVKKILQRGRAWLGECVEQRLAAIGVER